MSTDCVAERGSDLTVGGPANQVQLKPGMCLLAAVPNTRPQLRQGRQDTVKGTMHNGSPQVKKDVKYKDYLELLSGDW